MYCIKCGVKLADTEKKCPLCNTTVYHPQLSQADGKPLYPENKMPKVNNGSKVLQGAVIILFFIPLLICFFADMSPDGALGWFGYVAGASVVAYVVVALPMWFRKPNPVIFVPCDFAAVALYLLHVNESTNGNWFLSFALPVVGCIGIITCTLITLLYYLKRGKLYIFGGAFMASGAFMLLMEFLMTVTFDLQFIGWSIYPLVVLMLFGGLLIYLGISASAREIVERKMFF